MGGDVDLYKTMNKQGVFIKLRIVKVMLFYESNDKCSRIIIFSALQLVDLLQSITVIINKLPTCLENNHSDSLIFGNAKFLCGHQYAMLFYHYYILLLRQYLAKLLSNFGLSKEQKPFLNTKCKISGHFLACRTDNVISFTYTKQKLCIFR